MRKTAVLALVVSIAMLAAPAASADSASRPLKGSAVGSVSFVVGTECQNYDGLNVRTDGNATGTSSHLGRTVLITRHCAPEGPQFAGTATLVAANGDEVYVEYHGTNEPPDPGTSILVSTAGFVIVGGSGRFQGAEGGGKLIAYVLSEGLAVPEWPATWVWDGTIGY